MPAIRIWLLACALAAVLTCRASHAAAAEFRPVLVWSFAGYQEAAADLEYLGSTIQNPNFAQTMGRLLAGKSQIAEIKGLDPLRPWGAAISTDGLAVAPVAFFPVTSTQELLDSIEPLIGPAERTAEGLWKIGRGVLTGYVKEKEGWAYLAQSPETLQRLPDPVRSLGDLPQTYDWALRIYPQQIPEALRTMAIDQIRLQIRDGLGQRPGESDREYALRRRLAERNFGSLEELLAHGERVTFGWSIDRATRKAALELQVTPAKGSVLAGQLAALRPASTEFAAVGQNGAALVLRAGGGLDESQVRQFGEDLEVWRGAMAQWIDAWPAIDSDRQRHAFHELAGAVIDVCQSATATGRIDAALALEGDSPPFTVLAAARISNGQTAERLTARLARLAEAQAGQYTVRLDALRIGEARVHTVEFAGLADEPAYRSLFGDGPTLYIALDKQRAVVAMGDKAQKSIEVALRRQEAPAAPLALSIKLGSVVAGVAGLASDTQLRTLLALVGANLKSADHTLLFTLESNDQGLRVRLEAGEGVLRAAALGLSLGAIQWGAGN